MGRTLTVAGIDRASREVTLDEALLVRTYKAAINGNRTARREILKKIAEREKAKAAIAPDKQISEIKRCTLKPESLGWPRVYR